MKYDIMCKAFGTVMNGMVKEGVKDKKVRRAVKKHYKEIILRAADIGGSRNKLFTSYTLAAYFIALNRGTGLSPEENYVILENGMRKSRLLKLFMGDANSYFSEKNMESRRAWSKLTHDEAHKKQYPNDWVVDVIEKNGEYEFGFDYLECGDCKLCRDEQCPHLTKYLCRLDYLLMDIMGLHLDRTTTLAEGGPKCDFRFKK